MTRLTSLVLVFALVVPALLAQGTPADDKIYDAVRTKLANDPDVRGAGIDVTVKAGAVTLKGKVHDEKGKEKATKVAKSVKGVVSVDNQLKLFGQD